MNRLLLCLIVFALVLGGCNNSNEPTEREKELEKMLETTEKELYKAKKEVKKEKSKTPEELREELAEKEADNPLDYLSVSGKWWVNIVSSTVVEGKIRNSATMVKYKDVKIKITFNSKTGTKLNSDTFIIYEYVKPGGSKYFKEKLNYWIEDAKGINLEVVSATPV